MIAVTQSFSSITSRKWLNHFPNTQHKQYLSMSRKLWLCLQRYNLICLCVLFIYIVLTICPHIFLTLETLWRPEGGGGGCSKTTPLYFLWYLLNGVPQISWIFLTWHDVCFLHKFQALNQLLYSLDTAWKYFKKIVFCNVSKYQGFYPSTFYFSNIQKLLLVLKNSYYWYVEKIMN